MTPRSVDGARLRLRVALRTVAVLLLPLVAGACISVPCWCGDPEAAPRLPGRDGRDATRSERTPRQPALLPT